MVVQRLTSSKNFAYDNPVKCPQSSQTGGELSESIDKLNLDLHH